MWRTRNTDTDPLSHGRRAAEAMDIPRVLDRTLEMLFGSSNEPDARAAVTKLRATVQDHRAELVAKVAEIYAAVYHPDHLKALVEFLESPAGQAMRAKQADVEERVRRATQEFLQTIMQDGSDRVQ